MERRYGDLNFDGTDPNDARVSEPMDNYYNPNGRAMESMKMGVNIICNANGTKKGELRQLIMENG